MKKRENKEEMVVSSYFSEARAWEQRYKALRKTVKNLKKFNEAQINGKVAEA